MIKDLDKKVAHAMELHYERGFVDGMQKQMQSSVDKAVNRMAQTQEPDYWLGYGLQAHTEKPFEGATPLYTTPPQRTWVGLTNEEMKELWENKGWYVTMYKAVEAKLKEKNT